LKNGGRRPGAGRKRKPENVLKEMELKARIKKAEEAFQFEYDVMNDKSVPWGIRLEASKDIQDRVYGKPKQVTDFQSKGKSLLDILYEVYGLQANVA
jgi:hypothetical protein